MLALARFRSGPFSPAAPAAVASRFEVHGANDPQRADVERFIHGVYKARYGANVRQFAPMLVSLHDDTGAIVAAAGYRVAESGPLFLERYLQAPVESLLTTGAAPYSERARIVEVGHLAAVKAGAGRRLILLMGPYLAAQEVQWVVSTLTEELRHLFLRLGITPLALAVADPDVLSAEAANWGSYYDHRPVVVAGQIDQALSVLARRKALA